MQYYEYSIAAGLSRNNIDCSDPSRSDRTSKFPQHIALSEMGLKSVIDLDMNGDVELTRLSAELITMAHMIGHARRVLLPA